MRAAERKAVDSGRNDLIVVHDVPLLAEGGRAADGYDLVVVVDVPGAELVVSRALNEQPGSRRAHLTLVAEDASMMQGGHAARIASGPAGG
jgi:hypothetical protein